MPPALNPKVWWLLIGTNNLGVDNCNADAITVGNIRIVEEVRRHYPNAPIVINSLLPRESTELLHKTIMWQVIQQINSKLSCYADTHANLHFYNATDLFVETREDGLYVNKTLMNDYIHPSGEGAMKWGQAIIKQLETIIARAGGRRLNRLQRRLD